MKHLATLAFAVLLAACQTSSPGVAQAQRPLQGLALVDALIPDEAAWLKMFGIASTHPSCAKGKELFSYGSFRAALKTIQDLKEIKEFLMANDTGTNLRELAAFLANVSQETTGAWGCPAITDMKTLLDYSKDFDCTNPDGGLCYVSEVGGDTKNYCEGKENSPYYNDPAERAIIDRNCQANQYFGRGALQITGPHNYGMVSEVLFGSPRPFLERPADLLSGNNAWLASITYWMKNVGGHVGTKSATTAPTRLTPHQAITVNTDFGKTIEIINGDIECTDRVTAAGATKVRNRVRYYQTYLAAFNKTLSLSVAGGSLQCIPSSVANVPPRPKSLDRCGVKWEDADKTCGPPCSDQTPCPSGLQCFHTLSMKPCTGKTGG